jgi:hypothetical protein
MKGAVKIGAEWREKAGGDDVPLNRWIDCDERREERKQYRPDEHGQAESRA